MGLREMELIEESEPVIVEAEEAEEEESVEMLETADGEMDSTLCPWGRTRLAGRRLDGGEVGGRGGGWIPASVRLSADDGSDGEVVMVWGPEAPP